MLLYTELLVASAYLGEEVFSEALLEHLGNGGIGGTEAVTQIGITYIGLALPEDGTVFLADRRREPGTGAEEYHLLLHIHVEDEIGLFRGGDEDPTTGLRGIIGHIFPFILGESVVGSGELIHYLYKYFVTFGRNFLKALGFKRGRQKEGCGHCNQ